MVIKFAVPLIRVALPRVDVPLINVTEPVGAPAPALVATVAVNVTDCPNVDGLGGEDPVMVVVVPALLTICVTDPMLVANFVEPP